MKRGIIALIILGLIIVGIVGVYWSEIRGAYVGVQPVTELPRVETPDETPENFVVPEGFALQVIAEKLKGPRTIVVAPSGNLMVAQTTDGSVVELIDTNNDRIIDTTVTLIKKLQNPHGIAEKCVEFSCEIFIAETTSVKSYTYFANPPRLEFKKKWVDLPPQIGLHFTRSLHFLPSPNENLLLISIGSSCNVCDEPKPEYASIQVLDTTTGVMKPYATGLRNSVFMTLHPVTGAVWAPDMGRDKLGDDTPPDELNIIEEGRRYGYPICYGQNVHDTEFDTKTYIRNPCMAPFETPALVDIPAHSSPLGIAFIPEEGWPEDMWHDALVAMHGSWNRAEPAGYTIVRFDFDTKGELLGVSDFVSGFLEGKDTLYGRPAGLLAMPGGQLFVTDDKAGRVYRLYKK